MIRSDRKYKCIFFDLDHTLWDYETNSRDTLQELYLSYDLQQRGVTDFDSFNLQFKTVNTKLWYLYDRGLITNEIIRNERFKQILLAFNAYEEKLNQDLSFDYLHSCPKKSNLMPHAISVLEYLSGQYDLTVVTNGFEEIQNVKLCAGDLKRFFNHVVTSQNAGYKKPSREIFDFAMRANQVQCKEVMMIGDNLITDIGGAKNACIDTVFYNPEKIAHTTAVNHEISCLSELHNIL